MPPGISRSRLAGTLKAAYAGGLVSAETLNHRLDALLGSQVVDPRDVVGDLALRTPGTQLTRRAHALLRWVPRKRASPRLLALDWTGSVSELLIGRSSGCDVVLGASNVSRRHARLVFRDGRWILHDLDSTNGTFVNGRRVGRTELRPGDLVELATERLQVD